MLADYTVTKRRGDEYFTGLICPTGNLINITGAKVGNDVGIFQCALPMIDWKPDYYQEIVATCTGRQSCEDLRLDTQGEIQCSWWDINPDDITYIQILYHCLPGKCHFALFITLDKPQRTCRQGKEL